jgi:xylan 1,4-beta-xylosidase
VAYPEEWIVEGFAQEGPKILKRGDYYHMVLAQGGTAGPAHRAHGRLGALEVDRGAVGELALQPDHPDARRPERWWSKGHATLVEGPDGKWWMVYHAYENGFYNLGRQTLLEPIEWTEDGWFRATGIDPAKPIPSRARRRAARVRVLRRLLDEQDGHPVELLQGHRHRPRAVPPRDGASC